METDLSSQSNTNTLASRVAHERTGRKKKALFGSLQQINTYLFQSLLRAER